MRIWDINPGYLNNQSLLGEHRELHGIVSIIRNNKKGYSKHPETMRWKGYEWALGRRHALLVSEMKLRSIKDHSPLDLTSNNDHWPSVYIDPPGDQFAVLEKKYKERPHGRIPLPQNTRELWAQHKYSVMARSPGLYKITGKEVSKIKKTEGFRELALRLAEILHEPPSSGNLKNTLEHMWGHVSDKLSAREIKTFSSAELLAAVQVLTIQYKEPYLTASTALGELAAWINEYDYIG
jgi:uncharacterized protein YbgA (DUF1722 family)